MQNKNNIKKTAIKAFKSQRNVLFFVLLFLVRMEIYFILWKSSPLLKEITFQKKQILLIPVFFG